MKSRIRWTIYAQVMVETHIGQVVEVDAHVHGTVHADLLQAIDEKVLQHFQFLDMGITGTTYQPHHTQYRR